MSNKTLWFGMTAETKEIQDGVVTFATATGWKPKITVDGEEVDNPKTAIEHGGDMLWNYIKETVKSYNANLGADAGRKQAIEATEARLESVTHEASVDAA